MVVILGQNLRDEDPARTSREAIQRKIDLANHTNQRLLDQMAREAAAKELREV